MVICFVPWIASDVSGAVSRGNSDRDTRTMNAIAFAGSLERRWRASAFLRRLLDFIHGTRRWVAVSLSGPAGPVMPRQASSGRFSI